MCMLLLMRIETIIGIRLFITNLKIMGPTPFFFRKDRKDGYGGVLIGVKRQLVYEHVPISDSCELVAMKVNCKHNAFIVASLYRPTNNDSDYTVQLINAIESLVRRHPNEVIWIGVDVNLPDINWSSNAVSGSNFKKEINESFLQAVENWGLDQIVDFQQETTYWISSLPIYPLSSELVNHFLV